MKRIFITGASSGIGKELALEYAKQKCVIGISARRHELLKNIAKNCNNLGSKTHVYQLAEISEKNNHHPDMYVGWCKVNIAFTSHDLGGVTKACITMAKAADEIFLGENSS